MVIALYFVFKCYVTLLAKHLRACAEDDLPQANREITSALESNL